MLARTRMELSHSEGVEMIKCTTVALFLHRTVRTDNPAGLLFVLSYSAHAKILREIFQFLREAWKSYSLVIKNLEHVIIKGCRT